MLEIRWKPWEYYYEDEAFDPWNEEEMRDYIEEWLLK